MLTDAGTALRHARRRLHWATERLRRALPIPVEHDHHGPLTVLACCGAPACTACDHDTVVTDKDGKGHVHVTSLPYIRWSPYCVPAMSRVDPLDDDTSELVAHG